MNNKIFKNYTPRKILVVCSHGMQSRLIEIADDHTLISCVETMTDAFQRLQETIADFVICDVAFPDGDVWRIAETLKIAELYPKQPSVIALTCGQNTDALQSMAKFKNVYLFDEEFPPNGLLDYIVQIEQIRAQLTQNKSVLVIDDHAEIQHAINAILSSGFNLDFADRGDKGLGIWRSHLHDLVILDLGLPDTHGTNILKTIIDEKPDQPVIVLTGSPSRENLLACMKNGAQTFLSKPISPIELTKTCYRVLNWADLSVIRQSECDNDETLRNVRLAQEYLMMGDISVSNNMLEEIQGQSMNDVELSDDDYF